MSGLCFILGFVSVIASIGVWYFLRTGDRAHAERFGIFVGLWAPTFFALSACLRLFAKGKSGGCKDNSCKEGECCSKEGESKKEVSCCNS